MALFGKSEEKAVRKQEKLERKQDKEYEKNKDKLSFLILDGEEILLIGQAMGKYYAFLEARFVYLDVMRRYSIPYQSMQGFEIEFKGGFDLAGDLLLYVAGALENRKAFEIAPSDLEDIYGVLVSKITRV